MRHKHHGFDCMNPRPINCGNYPDIDTCYLVTLIPERHRCVEKGYKKGNVVISVKHNDKPDWLTV